MKIQSHRDLIVWQRAMDLAVQVYQVSRAFPRSEVYALTSQLTRSVTSVAANIAEGHARGTARDYAQFLAVARGSLMETETLLTLAVRLDYIRPETARPAFDLITQLSKMLASLRHKILDRIP
ncbi:MAG: four helix bundle protein [Phycisphaerae bacterium]